MHAQPTGAGPAMAPMKLGARQNATQDWVAFLVDGEHAGVARRLRFIAYRPRAGALPCSEGLHTRRVPLLPRASDRYRDLRYARRDAALLREESGGADGAIFESAMLRPRTSSFLENGYAKPSVQMPTAEDWERTLDVKDIMRTP